MSMYSFLLFHMLVCSQMQKEYLLDCLAHFTIWAQAASFAHLRPQSIFEDDAFAMRIAAWQDRQTTIKASEKSATATASSSQLCLPPPPPPPPSRARLLWLFARDACVHVRRKPTSAKAETARRNYMRLFRKHLTRPAAEMRAWEASALRRLDATLAPSARAVYRCYEMQARVCAVPFRTRSYGCGTFSQNLVV